MDPSIGGLEEKGRFPRIVLLIPIAAAMAGSPAFAQYPPPGSVAPPGSIIVSRDVPQRPAFDPGQPGSVNTVQTAPVDIIFGATSQTVSILSDDETAMVTAATKEQTRALGAASAGAEAALNPQLGSGPGQVSASALGGGLGGSIANTINTATGAIGRALGPLSSIGGGN